MTGGNNDGLKFRNMATETEVGGAGDFRNGGGNNRSKRECCNCGGDHLKRNFSNIGGDKTTKDKYREWCI